jgi:hypothetical protein
MIDLKHVLVIVNTGSFKGYQRFLRKARAERNMAEWHYNKKFDALLHDLNNGV